MSELADALAAFARQVDGRELTAAQAEAVAELMGPAFAFIRALAPMPEVPPGFTVRPVDPEEARR